MKNLLLILYYLSPSSISWLSEASSAPEPVLDTQMAISSEHTQRIT